jgi:hypothetical protein
MSSKEAMKLQKAYSVDCYAMCHMSAEIGDECGALQSQVSFVRTKTGQIARPPRSGPALLSHVFFFTTKGNNLWFWKRLSGLKPQDMAALLQLIHVIV